MRKLWTFGDSFTEGYKPKHNTKTKHWRHHYIDWKGYVPKVYGEVLAEKFGFELRNYGMGSWDNYSIFESFCKVINEIKSDDVIIFGWSSPERFRIVGNDGYWKQMAPSYEKNGDIKHSLSDNTIDELFVNRMNRKYSEEINHWINLINFTFKSIPIIHWTPFVSEVNSHYFCGFETIRDETNGLIDDGHFSESGQVELANKIEFVYNKLTNKDLI